MGKGLTSTFGPAYVPEYDEARVHQQMYRIRNLMLDSVWRTLEEISVLTGDPQASISAQLRHLRKARFGAYIVEKRRRGEPGRGVWEYRIKP